MNNDPTSTGSSFHCSTTVPPPTQGTRPPLGDTASQESRAFEGLKRKFYCSGGRERLGQGYEDWGLQIFPAA